jgi:hypothetical protein
MNICSSSAKQIIIFLILLAAIRNVLSLNVQVYVLRFDLRIESSSLIHPYEELRIFVLGFDKFEHDNLRKADLLAGFLYLRYSQEILIAYCCDLRATFNSKVSSSAIPLK